MKLFQWMSSKKSNNVHVGVAAAAGASSKRELQDEEKVRDLVVYNNQRGLARSSRSYEYSEDDEGNASNLTFGPHRESGRSCFYRTLNLKHLKNMHRNNYNFWPTRREDHAGLGLPRKDETAIVPHKYPPTASSKDADRSEFNENNSHKGERRKTVSKMKELLRWATASKSNKEGANRGSKGSNIQSRAVLKAPSDYLSTSSSSKTSSRWDVGSCSTSSSKFSASSLSSASRNDQMWSRNLPDPVDNLQRSYRKDNQMGSPKKEDCQRTGRWISTDTIFVVLELRK